MTPKPWLFVCGTRPELIKLRPILKEFQKRSLPFTVTFTGQHDTLAAQTGFLDEFAVTALHLPSANDPLAYADACLTALLTSQDPKGIRGVIVQGDTASALAGGRYARRTRLRTAHVEAGLRSHSLEDPWPEERFRTELDRNATWLFAPTPLAYKNLQSMRSYRKLAHVWLVGNTVVDALLQSGIRPATPDERMDRVLVTLHRRESFGEPLVHIIGGLVRAAIMHPRTIFEWPVHPNPEVAKALAGTHLLENIRCTGPMEYKAFLGTLATSRAVLTDSGGVVEEAATLGVPCAIARDRTERQDAIHAGLALLAGRTSDSVATAIDWALHTTVSPSNTFGDGHAASRIADVLQNA